MHQTGMKHFKLVLVLLHVVFCLCGLLLVLQATLTLAQCSPYIEFSGSKYIVPLIILIAVGLAFVAVGIVGCMVSARDKRFAQSIVSSVFLVLLLTQIAASITSLAMKNDLETTVKISMLSVIEEYTTGDRDQLLDVVQSNFHCCGSNSITDWFTQLEPATNSTVPLSCCNTEGTACKYDYLPVVDPSPELEFYTKGCGSPVAEYLKLCHRTLDIAGMITIFIEIFCLIVMFYYLKRGKTSTPTIYKAVSSQMT